MSRPLQDLQMSKIANIVLVVDDDLAVRESLKFALEIEGLAVRACSGGAELLAHEELRKAGCILLDYKMPGMDGFAVLDRLDEMDLHIPVILMTGHVTEGLRLRSAGAGVAYVLEKPLQDDRLLNSIHQVLKAGHSR